MRFSFDINKNYEIPLITLCNPDRKEIASVSNISNLHIKPRFNAVSEVTFDISSVYFDSISNETKTLPYYNLIGKNRLLHIERKMSIQCSKMSIIWSRLYKKDVVNRLRKK